MPGLRLPRSAMRTSVKRPVEPLASELEVELAVLQSLVGVAERRPMAAVPDHDAAGPVLAFGYLAFEAAVVERMILYLHRKSAVLRVQARFFRHGPALQHAIVLEPEVVVQPRRVVLLHDVLQAAMASGAPFGDFQGSRPPRGSGVRAKLRLSVIAPSLLLEGALRFFMLSAIDFGREAQCVIRRVHFDVVVEIDVDVERRARGAGDAARFVAGGLRPSRHARMRLAQRSSASSV